MDTRGTYLSKLTGIENAGELLDKEGIQGLAAALEAKGIQHKAAEKDPVAETAKAENTFGALLLQMIDSQADILKEFDALKADAAAVNQTRTKEATESVERFKALEAENARLLAELQLSPRASIASETTLKGEVKAEAEQEIAKKQIAGSDGLDRYIAMVEGRKS